MDNVIRTGWKPLAHQTDLLFYVHSCDGPCLRSFHATVARGKESRCPSLKYSREKIVSLQRGIFSILGGVGVVIQAELLQVGLYQLHSLFLLGAGVSGEKTAKFPVWEL